MLSILIPVYNYNISNLVQEIHKQVTKLDIEFEIICFNDNSTSYSSENSLTISSLLNAKIINSKKNLGRVHARQVLCDNSNYDWLLFLDADVLPKSDTFIQNYINNLSCGYDAFFGGFAYTKKRPKPESILRWKYGRKFEEIDANKRNKKPHQLIISANFLIRKATFSKINSKIERKSYGLDNYFASLLKQNNINVLHLNNEVYHYGLENSKRYLEKTEETIITIIWAFNNKKLPEHDQKLLLLFERIKKIRLNYFLSFLYNCFRLIIKRNLLGKNPNLYLLQFYKLLYICHKDLMKE